MLKYFSTVSAILLVTVAFAANNMAGVADSPASVASMLRDYDYIRGEIDGLLLRANRIEADIDTADTDLRSYDSRLGQLSDSMIQLRHTCGEYLVMARKIRKTSPDISLLGSNKKVYRSMRRNGYINSDIVRAGNELRELTEDYFRTHNEKERIRYLLDHESDLYAMHDNIMDRVETLEAKAADVMTRINPKRDQAEAIILSRNANAARLDRELASNYIVRVKRERRKDKPVNPQAAPADTLTVTPTPTPAPTPTPGIPAQTPGTGVVPGYNAESTPSDDFSTNQGLMMFPVSGRYNIVGRFGTYTHPEFEHITVTNPGIDIESLSGSKARAVFPGKVESVFEIAGFNKVVVVNHGDYYTVYGNLSDVNVAENMYVRDGQIVGDIENDHGHTVLHFEVRLGSAPLDPTLWIKL